MHEHGLPAPEGAGVNWCCSTTSSPEPTMLAGPGFRHRHRDDTTPRCPYPPRTTLFRVTSGVTSSPDRGRRRCATCHPAVHSRDCRTAGHRVLRDIAMTSRHGLERGVVGSHVDRLVRGGVVGRRVGQHPSRRLPEADAAQPAEGTVLRDPHGARGRADGLRRLLRRQPHSEAQHEHLALTRGQVCEQRPEPRRHLGREQPVPDPSMTTGPSGRSATARRGCARSSGRRRSPCAGRCRKRTSGTTGPELVVRQCADTATHTSCATSSAHPIGDSCRPSRARQYFRTSGWISASNSSRARPSPVTARATRLSIRTGLSASDAVLTELADRQLRDGATREQVVRHGEIRRLAPAVREGGRALKDNRIGLQQIVAGMPLG